MSAGYLETAGVKPGANVKVKVVKPLLVFLLVAAFAGVEFFHEIASSHAPDSAVCMAPEGQQEAARDAILQHLHSHH